MTLPAGRIYDQVMADETTDKPGELKRVVLDVTVRVVGCPACMGVAPLTVRMDISEPWGLLIRCQLCGKRIDWGHIVDVADVTSRANLRSGHG